MELNPIPTDTAYACITSKLPEVIIGLGKQQAQVYVREMYQDPNFSDGVIKPTNKTTIVIISRFIEFLKSKEEAKFIQGGSTNDHRNFSNYLDACDSFNGLLAR